MRLDYFRVTHLHMSLWDDALKYTDDQHQI